MNEPTLGTWEFNRGSAATSVENIANQAFPFGTPKFDRALYLFFSTPDDALAALKDGEVDVILSPAGLPAQSTAALSKDPSITVTVNSSSSARFLVFSPANTVLADRSLRAALACMIDQVQLAAQVLQKQAIPLEHFVLTGIWQDSHSSSGCHGQDAGVRLQKAVQLLRSAGYTWTKEPAAGGPPGEGLSLPSGRAFPSITLLAPSPADDPQRAAAAEYIELQALGLGIPVRKELTSQENLRYAVFSARDFDMAILGWRLSAYPGYLCEWFAPGSPFSYGGRELKAGCDALAAATELEPARQSVYGIQSALATDLPFIPLYTTVTYDAYRNVSFPFDQVLDGIGSFYGAPLYAVPLR